MDWYRPVRPYHAIQFYHPSRRLPVEINASARAVSWLESAGIVGYETKPMAVDALKWAAYTYVIAALGSLATLLYYISIGNSRRS